MTIQELITKRAQAYYGSYTDLSAIFGNTVQ